MEWFRFYDEALNDPKVQRLPGDVFKTWVNLLCLASQQSERGTLPCFADTAWILRMDEPLFTAQAQTLVQAGLLEPVHGDARWAIHGWDNRQRKSDDVASRVRKHREKDSNVTVTLQGVTPVTFGNALEQNRTDTEQIQSRAEQSRGRVGAVAPRTRAPTGGAKPVKTSLPKTFFLTNDMRAWANAKYPGLDVDDATDGWLEWVHKNDAKFVDWYAAWQSGMRMGVKFGNANSNNNNGRVYTNGNSNKSTTKRGESWSAAAASIAAEAKALGLENHPLELLYGGKQNDANGD
jgi:hypothetical protein